MGNLHPFTTNDVERIITVTGYPPIIPTEHLASDINDAARSYRRDIAVAASYSSPYSRIRKAKSISYAAKLLLEAMKYDGLTYSANHAVTCSDLRALLAVAKECGAVRSANAAQRLLNTLDADEQWPRFLRPHLRFLRKDSSPESFVDELNIVRRAAIAARQKLERRVGHTTQYSATLHRDALHRLINELTGCYLFAFGRCPGTSIGAPGAANEGVVGGPMIRFMAEVLDAMGVSKSSKAIRLQIHHSAVKRGLDHAIREFDDRKL
jgi:hypothetical protein